MVLKEYRKGNQIFRLLKCDWCKKEIEIDITNRGHKKSKFCSGTCGVKYHNHKKNITKRCKFCKNEFQLPNNNRYNKFCSRSCFDSYRRRRARAIVDSIKFLQGEKVPNEEIPKRLSLSKTQFNNYQYRFGLGIYKGTKKVKKFNNKWTQEESSILIDHINKKQKGDPVDYLLISIKRTKEAIKSEIYRLRKQLTGISTNETHNTEF